MSARGRSLVVAASLAIGLLAATGAWADDPPPPFVVENKDPIVLEPEGEPVEVTIQNDTPQDYELTLEVTGPSRDRVSLSTTMVALESAGTAEAMLTYGAPVEDPDGDDDPDPDEDEEPEKFEAELVVSGGPEGREIVVRRMLLTEPKPVAPDPLVSTWHVTSYRFPWDSSESLRNDVIPLEAPETCATGDFPDGVVGGVSSPQGAVASVTVTCTDKSKAAMPTGARLAFESLLQETGVYTGTIDLDPADKEAGNVTLTVTRTDYWVLPLLVLCLGIGLAIWVLRHANRGDTLLQRRERLHLLRERIAVAQSTLASAAAGTPWSTLDPSVAVQDATEAAIELLSTLGRGWKKLEASDDDLVALDALLDDLATVAAEWEGLDELLHFVRDLANGLRVSAPTVASAVDSHIGATAAVTLDDLVAWLTETEAWSDALEGWPEAQLRLKSLGDWMALVDGSTAAETPPAVAAREALATATDLLTTGTEPSLVADAIAALDRANAALATTGVRRPQPGAAPITLAAALAVNPNALAIGMGQLRIADLPTRPARPAESDGDIARRIAGKRRWRNLVAIGATAAVALSTGMAALYAGKAFGTATDYIAIALWGFGAQATLELLVAGIDRLTTHVR